MKKRFITSLAERIAAGKALAIRRIAGSDRRALALIQASHVEWAGSSSNEPYGIATAHFSLTSLLRYANGCFGDPGVEQMAERYIYWVQHIPEDACRTCVPHSMIVRPIMPFRLPVVPVVQELRLKLHNVMFKRALQLVDSIGLIS
jgi:hypothetical protein